MRAPAQQRCRGEEKAWQGTRLRAPGEVGSTERVGSCTLCCAQQSDGKETGGEGYSGSAAASPSCCSLLLTTVQPSSQSGPAVPRTNQERRGHAHQEHESRASSRVNKPWAPSREEGLGRECPNNNNKLVDEYKNDQQVVKDALWHIEM